MQVILDVDKKIYEAICAKNVSLHQVDDLCRSVLNGKTLTTGRWLYLRPDVLRCSECGFIYSDISDEDVRSKNYCPSCGVKMEDPKTEDPSWSE